MEDFRPNQAPLVPPGDIDCHQRDMTATLSADVTLEAAQARLAQIGQWLPVDGDPRQSVGHLVAINSTGPLRLGFGGWRDLLLGCQFQNGRGELITAGGRTLKNVAGYDLTKLMIGQCGVFGRLVTVTMRTHPRPAGAVIARFAPDPKIVLSLLPTPCRPQAAILNSDSLLAVYFGDAATLDYVHAAVRSHRPADVLRISLQEEIESRSSTWTPFSGAFRAAVPPLRVMDFARRAGLRKWIADAAFGIVQGTTDEATPEKLIEHARGLGGTVTFFNADGSLLNASIDPALRPLLRRLKAALDPDHTLAPLPWEKEPA